MTIRFVAGLRLQGGSTNQALQTIVDLKNGGYDGIWVGQLTKHRPAGRPQSAAVAPIEERRDG